MTAFNYMGAAEDGRQFKFSNDAGATFTAYVSDSLQPMLQSMPPGTRLEAEIQQKTSKTGNTYTQVKSINGQRGQFGGGAGGGGSKPTGYNDKRFCEAICAAAVANGQIKSPADLAKWAQAAYSAISTVQSGAIKGQIAESQAPATPMPSKSEGQLDDPLPF